MSYALETKKRKFDRLLESLTENSSQPRTAPKVRNNISATSSGDGNISETNKKRRTTPTVINDNSQNASTTSLISHYLPSSRTALLERLETFRHVTKWHVPSTEPINASEWAKRGWTCVDTDTVTCGYCGERLRIDLEVESYTTDESNEDSASKAETENGEEDVMLVDEIHNAIIKRYQEMITSSHLDTCPWQERGCDSSIQRIEGLLNTSNAVSGLNDRYQSIASSVGKMPEVASLPERSQVNVSELSEFSFFHTNDKPELNALKLAICGWLRRSEDVLECRNCFRSLGLWLYRGNSPTMENLDAIESHLEYCPWRSAEAQDTELSNVATGQDIRTQQKEKVPGWLLVCQAIAKTHAKRRNPRSNDHNMSSSIDDDDDVEHIKHQDVSPEQREKKMKELMRRIKELKKPFNVKSLLKKKDKAKT